MEDRWSHWEAGEVAKPGSRPGNELNPMGCYRAGAEMPFRPLRGTVGGREQRNSYFKVAGPIRAVGEDEPLPWPGDRLPNQPRSNSGVSKPDRSAISTDIGPAWLSNERAKKARARTSENSPTESAHPLPPSVQPTLHNHRYYEPFSFCSTANYPLPVDTASYLSLCENY